MKNFHFPRIPRFYFLPWHKKSRKGTKIAKVSAHRKHDLLSLLNNFFLPLVFQDGGHKSNRLKAGKEEKTWQRRSLVALFDLFQRKDLSVCWTIRKKQFVRKNGKKLIKSQVSQRARTNNIRQRKIENFSWRFWKVRETYLKGYGVTTIKSSSNNELWQTYWKRINQDTCIS